MGINQGRLSTARTLYADEPTNTELNALMGATVYALDSTTIDLCLSLFHWAPFRTAKAAVKLHTLIDLRGSIPSFIHISDGKMNDVKVLALLCEQGYIEAGAFYVMDKAYLDFARLYNLHTDRAFFVTRAKANMLSELIQTFPVDISTGLVSDHHVQVDWRTVDYSIPRSTPMRHFHRCTDRQAIRVSHQQLCLAGHHDLRPLQATMASRVVLQVDQTASSNQSVLWQHRKRRQDADMGRDCDLRLDCYYEKAPESETFALRNSPRTGSKHV